MKCEPVWVIVLGHIQWQAGTEIAIWRFAHKRFIGSEGGKIRNKEKLTSNAAQIKALINHIWSIGPGMTIQRCSEFRQINQLLKFHIDKVLDTESLRRSYKLGKGDFLSPRT